MLSKSDSKFIKSLQLKKYRKATGRFIVEGEKNIRELLDSNYKIERLYLTPTFKHKIESSHPEILDISTEQSQNSIEKLGSLKSNNAGIALVHIKKYPAPKLRDNLTIFLEDIRDPGNFGTIIRIADWYGLKEIICSPTCADHYNPKVISASKGSVFRIDCCYTDLEVAIESCPKMIVGASLNGENVHQFNFPKQLGIVIGNESSGISASIMRRLDKNLAIPGSGLAESLNAGIATAIFCDNFERFNAAEGHRD